MTFLHLVLYCKMFAYWPAYFSKSSKMSIAGTSRPSLFVSRFISLLGIRPTFLLLLASVMVTRPSISQNDLKGTGEREALWVGLGKSALFELAPHTGIMSGSGLFGLKLAMNYGTVGLELSGEQVIGKYANTYPVFVGAVINFTTESRFIPYATAGVGVLTTVPTTTIGDETVSSMGFNAGAGARYYFTRTFGLRAEIKQVMTNVKNRREQKNEFLSFQQLSVGVSILVR